MNKDMPLEPVFVMADRDRLIQVVINLLSNAVKFCEPETGRVSIHMFVENGAARIEVADNGPGIPPGKQEQIFEKFHQIGDQQGGKPMGSGLGLSICQRIIEHHKGRIWVESNEDEGATFIFTLPLVDKH
jgi:signal transduction histidine kinase